MSASRIVPVLVAAGFAALLGTGVWLLSGTPGSLVNEEPHQLGPTPQMEAEAVAVLIEEGDSADDVADGLERADVIESARLFRVLASLTGLADDLVAGEYEFERGEATLTVLRRISQGLTSSLVVTIPEGLRAEEVGELLESRGVVSAEEFRAALDDTYEASFLDELPATAGLEGFLFPAKYGFSHDATGHEVVQQLLDGFDQRYRDELLPVLGREQRSLLDAVIIASIIEREACVAEERPTIAGVFLNRLASGIPLQADPTVQYALGSNPQSVAAFGYWKEELTLADLGVDSPYNTYSNVGLPPGPIANPGLDSLMAALEPADTNFLFFVARPDGSHVFAETLEEH
ncbi:MAG: endolytic transglycosylase MltG, partial [Dehalococcoidia bacterium]|nr:endolytic transglycosylase MltG [Dehalococcoidia bacterium]